MATEQGNDEKQNEIRQKLAEARKRRQNSQMLAEKIRVNRMKHLMKRPKPRVAE